MLSKEMVNKIKMTAPDVSGIEIKECGEDLVSIRSRIMEHPFWQDDSVLIREIEGKFYAKYMNEHANFKLLVRHGVMDRLLIVKESLPKHWLLVLRAGYRPLQVQEAMFVEYFREVQGKHPEWSSKKCTSYAEQYISNPSEVTSPHVTGGAVDVDIYDTKQGCLVDMGSEICELSMNSHCLTEGLKVQQRKNQETLIAVMCGAGFAPFPTEWWHFSYGDQRWASFYGKKQAIYGNTSL